MVDETLTRIVLDRLPPLLKTLDMPYTVDQVSVDLHVYDDIGTLVKQAGSDAGVFEADFDDEHVYLKSSLTKGIARYAFNRDRIVLLDSLLVHELLHYKEEQLTPEEYYYPAIKKEEERAMPYQLFVELMVNQFRDAVVYELTPRKYFRLFQLYKIGEMCSSSSGNEEKFSTMLEKNEMDFVEVKFAPVAGLPILINLYRDLELMMPLFTGYMEFIEKSFPSQLPRCVLAIQMLEYAFGTIKGEMTYDENLTRYGIGGLYVALSDLPTVTINLYMKDVKRAFNSAILPLMKKEHRQTKAREKTGRNDPCPCGSGKKYKKCCWLKDYKKESSR